MWSDLTFKRIFLATVGTPEWKQWGQDTVIQDEMMETYTRVCVEKVMRKICFWICFAGSVNRICCWWLHSKREGAASSRMRPGILFSTARRIRLLTANGKGFWWRRQWGKIMRLAVNQWEWKFENIWVPWLSSHTNIQKATFVCLHTNAILKFGDLEIFKISNLTMIWAINTQWCNVRDKWQDCNLSVQNSWF